MRIVNIMFARGGGGIEQAFVDYCVGLKNRGHESIALIYPGALVEKDLALHGIRTMSMRNLGEWDIFAVRRLRKILDEMKPDAVIAHANRAFGLSRKAIKPGTMPLVGVVQNYNTRRYNTGDATFTTTRDLIQTLVTQAIPESTIYHIPNMVQCDRLPYRAERNHPPVIGTMGRFVAKKGFDVYIEALSILKKRGYHFKAMLGGDGDEAANLKNLVEIHGLGDIITLPGWVKDKGAFYGAIDIFCLPSLHEPFGIVLLEAFAHGVPVVATDSEGPKDIITANLDALIVPIGKAEPLASALATLLDNKPMAESLAANAFAKVKTLYTIEAVAEKIEKALVEITAKR